MLTKDTMAAACRLQLLSPDHTEVIGISNFIFNPCFILGEDSVRICVYESGDLDDHIYKSFCEFLGIAYLRIKHGLVAFKDPETGESQSLPQLFPETKAVVFTKTEAYHFCNASFEPLDLTHPFVYGLGGNVFHMFKAAGLSDLRALSRTVQTVPGIGFDVTSVERADMADNLPVELLDVFTKSLAPPEAEFKSRGVKRQKIKRLVKVPRHRPKFRPPVSVKSVCQTLPEILRLEL